MHIGIADQAAEPPARDDLSDGVGTDPSLLAHSLRRCRPAVTNAVMGVATGGQRHDATAAVQAMSIETGGLKEELIVRPDQLVVRAGVSGLA